MTDCIIIGSGLAGISAALTLKANAKSFIMFGSKKLSEKIEKAELIRNYPGLSDISGKDFVSLLKKQLKEADIEVHSEKAAGVYAMKDYFSVMTQEGNTYESRAVILACGVEAIRQIEGEDEFLGRGVSACATCDGFLYKGKIIAVLCTSKRLEHEIKYLADFASKVYLIPMYKDVELQGANIEIIRKMPTRIAGDKRADRLMFAEGELKIDGMFVLRESVSPAVLVGGLKTENGHVTVGRDMSTNLKGCFAAGDCTGRPYQYAKAAGEGNIAAHSVSVYLK